MPLPVSDIGDGRQAEPAAVPAFLRRLPWPALQHRELCAAAAHAGAAMRSGAGRVHLDGRRHAYLQQPHGAGAAAADARTAAAATPGRTEERRVGKGGVITGSSRWSRVQKKKK